MKNMLSSFETSISLFNEEFEKMKMISTSIDSSLESISKENETLRETVQDLKFRQMDQLSRANNIELQGVPENKPENLITIVKQASKIITCPINDSDIHYCSRVAKQNTNNSRPRSILVKFSSPRLRDTFLAATTTFNKKNSSDKFNTSHLGIGGDKKPIYIVEHLSPENKILHAATRKKSKELNYKFVWIRSGKIFVRKNEESNYIYIRNTDTLNKLS